VSNGYGVYRKWVGMRRTCLVYLIRTAKALVESKDAEYLSLASGFVLNGSDCVTPPEGGVTLLLWALGIPIPILLILFVLRGCT